MNTSKKVLFIRFRKPSGIKDGGEQGTQEKFSIFCKLFGEQNIEEYYIHPNLKHETAWRKIKHLPYIFANYYFGLTPKKVRQICKIAQHKDIVFIDRSIFGIIAKHLKQNSFSGKIITYFQNVEVAYYEARYPKYLPFRQYLLNCINQNDAYAMLFSDATICLNLRDEKELQQRYNKKVDTIIPITLEDRHPPETSVPIAVPPTALFLGAYFPANVDGVLWFIEKVLPSVDINLQIVGKGMHRLENRVIEANSHPSLQSKIQIFSDVENVAPFIESCDLIVLPIFKGSGMKVKTCEALMYGKHIFGTKEAFEGYDLDFQKIGACCENATDFITAINQFIQSQPNRFNSFSRQTYLEKYQSSVAQKLFDQITYLPQ